MSSDRCQNWMLLLNACYSAQKLSTGHLTPKTLKSLLNYNEMFSEHLTPGQKKWLAEMLLCHTAEHDPQSFDDVYSKVGDYIVIRSVLYEFSCKYLGCCELESCCCLLPDGFKGHRCAMTCLQTETQLALYMAAIFLRDSAFDFNQHFT